MQRRLRRTALSPGVQVALTPTIERELAAVGLRERLEIIPTPVDLSVFRPPDPDERRDVAPGGRDALLGSLAEGVKRRRVSLHLGEVGHDRLDDLRVDRRRRTVIQIDPALHGLSLVGCPLFVRSSDNEQQTTG